MLDSGQIKQVVVIHDFCVARGGAGLLAVRSAVELRRRGLPVTFLSGDDGINPALAAEGVTLVGLGEQSANGAPRAGLLLKALYNRAAYRFLSNWIARNDTPGTIYHMHNWSQILSPAALDALRPVQARLAISTHDFFHVCPNGSFSFLKTGVVCELKPMSVGCMKADCDRRNYGFKLWRLGRQAVRNHVFDTAADVPVLAIHDRMRPFFERGGVPAERIVTVPNPVEPFTPERIPVERNDELVFVGRLESTKGPDLAAAAAKRAGVKLRLIGAGALGAQLARDHPEAILDGHRPRETLAGLLGRARALIMPSRYPEPYGLVAVEALWSGLPVIIAATAFLAPDIVAAGAGIAIEPRDIEATAAAITRIFSDDAVARTMSDNAITRTRAIGHTMEGWIDALIGVYRERLRRAPAARLSHCDTIVHS